MDLKIRVTRESTGDVAIIPLLSAVRTQLVGESYLSQRLGLERQSVFEICLECRRDTQLESEEIDGMKHWRLEAGKEYLLFTRMDRSEDSGAPLERSEDGVSPVLDTPILPPVSPIYRISASDILLKVRGTSEISRFVKEYVSSGKDVVFVDCLPKSYNGDTIFELPPISGTPKRGSGLIMMDRDNDCYRWTRIITTSANIIPKDLYQFGKVRCSGMLECRNDLCSSFVSKKVRNITSWSGKSRGDNVHRVGGFIPDGGTVCFHCNRPPFCVSECPAKMFYVYPLCSVEREKMSLMSRLAIHSGYHSHPPISFIPREAMRKAESEIRFHHSLNPSATPSKLKNAVTGSLMAHLAPETAIDMTPQEIEDIWSSLMAVASRDKFHAIMRNVRMENPLKRDFDSIQDMQKNIQFPFIQRFLFPGQGAKTDRAHIFKMSVKGPGSGLSILERMQKNRSLEGAWVSFDVMHRITSGWLTFSAHVYDHNIRALCTIFTCELKSEDAESLATAWRLMVGVAAENGLKNVEIYGFMADNAIAGWNAVRNVFWNGIPNPERERSDAFHFQQSLQRHTREGILESKRDEHLHLWSRLRNAATYVQAYQISFEIQDWWKAGNCIPGKLRYLQGWLAWWVVRWRQWGNYIRLVGVLSTFSFGRLMARLAINLSLCFLSLSSSQVECIPPEF